MKVAVLGAGVMGRTHARDLAAMPHVRLAGVCDAQEQLATELAARCGTKAYFDFEEMMEDARPDVLSICLPTYLHLTYAEKAARRGVHVICEKPLAPTLSEAGEMIRMCERYGVKLYAAHVVRFFPSYRDMGEKIAADAIGRIGVAHAKRAGGHPGTTKRWYKDHARSGGVILDLMIHDIDFMRSVLGEVDTVYAMNRTTDEIDYALVTLRFRSGAIANLEGHWGYPGPFTTAAEFAGTKGIIRFDSRDAVSVRVRKRAAAGGADQGRVAVPASPAYRDPYYYELEHFLACIERGQAPIVSAEDGYEAMKIAFAAIASAKTGRPVRMQDMAGESGGLP